MFDYLYYKLYKSLGNSSLYDIAEFTAAAYLGGLIGMNFFVLDGFLAKLKVLPFFLGSKNEAIVFGIACIAISLLYFLATKRNKSIIKKYSSESDDRRKRGNTIVWIYVIISFLSIFAVSFFRPGKI